jgi:hypothetical protein
LKYTITLQTAIATAVLVGQEFFIRLAYSSSFIAAVKLVPYQLMGDFFYFILQVFSVYYLGASFFRVNIIGWTLYYGTLASLTLLAVTRGGLSMVPITYAVVNAAFAIFILILFFKKHRSQTGSLFANGLSSFLTLLGAVAITLFHFPWAFRLVPFVLFGCYFYFYRFRTREVHAQ